MNNNDKTKELLTRGVDEIISLEDLEKKIKNGDKLRIKLGIDPTSPNIHLGRSIPLLKLRDFQLLGHKIVLIIGDFTGLIGDTSDKESERPMLSEETVKENLKTYIDQASKIIDMKEAEIHYNSKWLGELGYKEIGKQADVFSINDFISRDNIAKRLSEGKRVSLREVMYPLMQGYDSVVINADVEIGGTDQRFNILAGRDLQRLYGQEPQNIVMNPLIEGLDGRKMSSSYGNTINLFDTPNDMFGKLMTVADELIIKYFTMLTRVDLETIEGYKKDLADGTNPRDIKINLGRELVRMYHGEEEAESAVAYFVNTFTKKEIPTDVPEFKPASGDYNISSVLIESELVSSKGEVRRLLEQGGIKIDGEVISDASHTISAGPSGVILQKGKIHFLRII
jgi:tyrosyl-tRNA synthetase